MMRKAYNRRDWLNKGQLPPAAAVIMYKVALLIFACSLKLAADSGTDAAVAYEAFVASPPIVEELLFEDEPMDSDHVIATFGPDRPAFYLARWQPDAFTLLSLRGTNHNKGESVSRASGRVGTFFWSYNEERGLNIYTRTDDSLIYERSNGVVHTHLADLQLVSWIMNLGVPAQEIGSIRWYEHRFKRTNSLGSLWEGELLFSSNGLPAEILFTVKDPQTGQTFHNKTRLGYGESGTLPSSIRYYTDFGPRRGGWHLMKSFRIHALRTNKAALPEEAFLYSSLNLVNTNTVLYSNDARFLLSRGMALPINVLAAHTRRELLLKRTGVIVLLALAMAVPWLLWRLTSRQKPPSTS